LDGDAVDCLSGFLRLICGKELEQIPVGMQRVALLAVAAALLAGCASPPRPAAVNPDAVRAEIERLMPARVTNAQGWAIDIYAAFEA
jgi:outer membrane biogenesis lipoprotein LolB